MSKLYSPSTGSCYVLGMHQLLPDDVIEISDDVFKSVIGSHAPDRIRVHMTDGTPYLVDRNKSVDELIYEERSWRDAQLAASEWLVNRHRDESDMQAVKSITDDEFASLLAYRQALRDLPSQIGFPDESARPPIPEWLAVLAATLNPQN